MSIFDDAYRNTTVEIETALTPPVRVNVADASTDGPNLLTRILRPRVVVRTGESVLYRVEPAGAPDPNVRMLLGLLAALALLYFALRVAK